MTSFVGVRFVSLALELLASFDCARAGNAVERLYLAHVLKSEGST